MQLKNLKLTKIKILSWTGFFKVGPGFSFLCITEARSGFKSCVCETEMGSESKIDKTIFDMNLFTSKKTERT